MNLLNFIINYIAGIYPNYLNLMLGEKATYLQMTTTIHKDFAMYVYAFRAQD